MAGDPAETIGGIVKHTSTKYRNILQEHVIFL